MGLFQHRPEDEENQWAGLPSEPLEREGADVLDAPPPVDPMAIGLGAAVSSVALPATPLLSEETTAPEPEDDPDE